MAVIIEVGDCSECQYRDHSGNFTPGGAKPQCSYGGSKGTLPYKTTFNERRGVNVRVPTYKIPSWCPLKKENLAKEATMANEPVVLQDFIDWKRVSVELRTLKAKESKLRDRLTSTVLQGSMEPVKYFVDGYNIKATPKTTLKIDEAVLSSIMEYLTDAEKLLVTYKPSITKANIKKVPPESPLMEAIIEKPGKSTLSVEFEVSDGD